MMDLNTFLPHFSDKLPQSRQFPPQRPQNITNSQKQITIFCIMASSFPTSFPSLLLPQQQLHLSFPPFLFTPNVSNICRQIPIDRSCNFISNMRRVQHYKKIAYQCPDFANNEGQMFASAEQLNSRILTEYSREKSLEKNIHYNLSPIPNKHQALFDNIKKIGSNIYKSHQYRIPNKHPWKPKGKLNPQETFSISPKKKKLILVEEHIHAPSKLLRESKSTECPTPKEITKISFGSVSKFQTIKLLGKGRFGEVYLARHRKTGFIGALKIIRKSDIMEIPFQKRERIIRQIGSEIKLQSYLNHPNLVKLYDFFDDRQNIYLFVELGSDGHLLDLLQMKGTLSEESTAIIIRQVVKGVQHLHSKQIMHRDLKLENIVLTHGMAKICDFGWSVYEPGEFRKTICGTPLYLSPQILKRERYNMKSDIWALGPLTYEMISKDNPFMIKNRDDLDKIITKDAVLKVGSPQIKSFINFILRKDPNKRPDAEILLQHPFMRKYEGLETSEEISDVNFIKSK